MDKAAHFHRCDFQVHTPRDINWLGFRPVSQGERREYARGFIAACRAKGLDAVAITDHHDLGFFPYIKEAANDERDAAGALVPDEKKIVVFPGMELTLGIPCQALLLLDAEFPINMMPAIYNVLAIEQNAPNEAVHGQIQRLDHIKDFGELYRRLNEQTYLRGHFIVIPNVSSGGATTLQRPGFLAHYKSMPCVAGYLDGGVDQLGVGDANILDGKVEAYGFKPLGVFPTSDNRQADFANLGLHTAWVKWAEPTAEALRQACLAKQTRILHAEPETPSLIIEAIHVSNSKFMGPIDLDFNTQFNCLIGGRGTGKSTVLEYLRWALCDQPPAFQADEELPDFQSKRASLIKNTLYPHTVTVHFSLNGVSHEVRRKSETQEILLKIGDAEFKPCREEDVRDLLGVQAYSQKQLSAVGVRTDELIRFIQAPLAKHLNAIGGRVDTLKGQIRNYYALIQQKRQPQAQVERESLELASLAKQIEALQKGLKNLTPEDQEVLGQHQKYLVEEQLQSSWDDDFKRLREIATAALEQVAPLPSQIAEGATLLNQDVIQAIAAKVKIVFDEAKQFLQAILKLVSEESNDVEQILELKRQGARVY